MKKRKDAFAIQLLMAITGVGMIANLDGFYDAVGVALMIWSNNFDYKLED